MFGAFFYVKKWPANGKYVISIKEGRNVEAMLCFSDTYHMI